jgi:hypothetical protein
VLSNSLAPQLESLKIEDDATEGVRGGGWRCRPVHGHGLSTHSPRRRHDPVRPES